MLTTKLQGWLGHWLALIAGALVTPSLAPFNLWPLGIVSVTLLALVLHQLSPLAAAKRGWFYGLGLFGSGTSWVYVSIHVYGYAPVPLAAFLTLLFCAGLAILSAGTAFIYVKWLRDSRGGQFLGFAAIWVLGEWWRSWFLTGFPWLYIGYSHIDTALAGWAPVSGIFGLGFIVALSGAALAIGIIKRQWLTPQLITVLTLWLLGALLNTIDWTTPTAAPALKVAMVQANIPQQIKWNRDQYQPTLKLYQQTSKPLWSEQDLVIWPEAAIPGYYHRAKGFLDSIAAEASQHQSTLVTGLPYRVASTLTAEPAEPAKRSARHHNSIIAIGNGNGTYHKQRLVPFGEFIPMEGLLRGLIQFFDMPMSAFNPGDADQQGLHAGALALAPFICYEIVYPDLVASWLPETDLLITISNDAWFGASIGPLQHLQMAQMRALENGRYLLRSTGSGVSAIIDQRGHITVRGGQFKREVITGEALAYQGSTPFSITGSWPILLLCLTICIVIVAISSRSNAVKMRG